MSAVKVFPTGCDRKFSMMSGNKVSNSFVSILRNRAVRHVVQQVDTVATDNAGTDTAGTDNAGTDSVVTDNEVVGSSNRLIVGDLLEIKYGRNKYVVEVCEVGTQEYLVTFLTKRKNAYVKPKKVYQLWVDAPDILGPYH